MSRALLLLPAQEVEVGFLFVVTKVVVGKVVVVSSRG